MLLVLAAITIDGEPQHYYPMYSDYFPPSYFRSAASAQKVPVADQTWVNRQRPLHQPQSSQSSKIEPLQTEGRWLFYSAYTLTVSTTTVVATSTVRTTCTTSTTALTTCTAGRRRRGLFYDESQGRRQRSLFHNEDETEADTIISQDALSVETDSVGQNGPERSPRQVVSSTISEQELLSNYKGEWGALLYRDGRFLNIAIATTTSTTTTTLTQSLTAACASTTSYNVCISSG